MKTIIAGPRKMTDYTILCDLLNELQWNITEVVCGMAIGVDLLGHRWATENGIIIKEMEALWRPPPDHILDLQAGNNRNITMGDYADNLIAIWDGKSTGTNHMIKYMTSIKKPVWVHRTDIETNSLFDLM